MKKRRKIRLKYKKERVLFSDILPYEVPLIFTNRFFYRFLVSNGIAVDLEEKKIKWNKNISDGAFTLLKVILNPDNKNLNKKEGSYNLKKVKSDTIPFTYKIAHKATKHRELTIIHPANQIMIVAFYERYKHLILHYCNQSQYSLRHAKKIAYYFYFKDRLHHQLLNKDRDNLEMYFNEYENLKSFFTYKKYPNIYRFYEDYRYQRAEKKFSKLLKFDIQGCFDNIYTHSISWATNGGKEILKSCINKYGTSHLKETFGDEFDSLMQKLNYNETNGIVIGPELSRIFAEIILQYIDKCVEAKLKEKSIFLYKDYECYRYVDDYFLFYNNETTKNIVLEEFIVLLKEYKLNISDSKTEIFEKPFITKISIAKIKIDLLISDNISYRNHRKTYQGLTNKTEKNEEEEGSESLSIKQKIEETLERKDFLYSDPNRFNTKFKSIVKETNVEYKDILNYSLACIINSTERVVNKFDKHFKVLVKAINNEDFDFELKEKCKNRRSQEEKMIVKYFLSLIDSIFFLYSNNKRISTTLKVVSFLNLIILYLKNDYKKEKLKRFTDNSRHRVFKKIQDELNLVFQTTPFNENTQLESLYFLIVLKEMGTLYRLSPTTINSYLGIKKNNLEKIKLNSFTITILLYYYGNATIYNDNKTDLISIIENKYKKLDKEKITQHAELIILSLDLLTCPYIKKEEKEYIAAKLGIKNEDYNDVMDFIKKQRFWFTRWTGLDLNKELNAKISQDVYS